MSQHPTQLKQTTPPGMVAATLETELTLDDLIGAERVWASARVDVIQALVKVKVPRNAWPESLHWNWGTKAMELAASVGLGGFSPKRVMGIHCQSQWQGILRGTSVGHPTRLAPTGRDQVYIDYVEIAPWNWDLPAIGQAGRFRGIGIQLFEMAVRWSQEDGFRGRVGLHALPQAEDFYRQRCGMTDGGPDASYCDLRYFEFTEDQANRFLRGNRP